MFSPDSHRVRRFRAGCEALEGRDLQAVAPGSLGRVMLNPQPPRSYWTHQPPPQSRQFRLGSPGGT
jgi:hypothetical protein